MRNFRLLASDIDVQPLLQQLELQEDAWTADLYWKRHPLPIFRDVDSILLRFPAKPPYTFESIEAKAAWDAANDWRECSNTEMWNRFPAAQDIIFRLMAGTRATRLGRVMINRLRAGARIPAHSDIAPALKYYQRFHVVLATNAACAFSCLSEFVHMRTGSLWWFDNSKEHSVQNLGHTDRVHLVIDLRIDNEE